MPRNKYVREGEDNHILVKVQGIAELPKTYLQISSKAFAYIKTRTMNNNVKYAKSGNIRLR